MENKKTIFSGIQPSGVIHIGNYLGALKQWVALQDSDKHDSIFCVVDLHAITVPQNPAKLRENTLKTGALYIASGIDPKKSIIFVQSHVPAHAELGWILNTITPLGELERMTQFKDKSALRHSSGQAGVLAGLLNYPTLMAADILLYQTDAVPVGEDQAQHVELTRSIAERFNNRFGNMFKVPKLMLVKEGSPDKASAKAGARVMGLDDPTKKMSKSAPSEMNYISMEDTAETIARKIKSATTDSGNEIRFDSKEKPGISNLLVIASAMGGKTISELESEFAGKTYSDFKSAVSDIVIHHLEPIQKRYEELMSNKDELMKILRGGAEKAKEKADGTMRAVRQAVGFVL